MPSYLEEIYREYYSELKRILEDKRGELPGVRLENPYTKTSDIETKKHVSFEEWNLQRNHIRSLHSRLRSAIGEVWRAKKQQTNIDEYRAMGVGLAQAINAFKATTEAAGIPNTQDGVNKIVEAFRRLPASIEVLQQFRANDRTKLEIADERDLQDFVEAVLKCLAADVRKEEYSPSQAGASSRIDFYLPELECAI